MLDFLKTANWRTSAYGAFMIACAVFGFFNEAATGLCHTAAELATGFALIEGVDKTRLKRIVAAVDGLLGYLPEYMPPTTTAKSPAVVPTKES